MCIISQKQPVKFFHSAYILTTGAYTLQTTKHQQLLQRMSVTFPLSHLLPDLSTLTSPNKTNDGGCSFKKKKFKKGQLQRVKCLPKYSPVGEISEDSSQPQPSLMTSLPTVMAWATTDKTKAIIITRERSGHSPCINASFTQKVT